MSNQEAIALLRNLEDSLDSYCELSEEGKTAFRMAIEALSSSEFPNNSDCISRQAAIEALETVGYDFSESELSEVELEEVCGAVSDVRQDMIGRIKQLPPAQPAHITSRWIPIGMADAVGGESAMWGDKIAYHVCEKCWEQALERDGEEVLSDFCPHCGAKMEEGDG